MIENNEPNRAVTRRGPISPLLVEWLLIGVATPLLFLSTASMICGMFLIITAWIVRRRAYGCWRLATLADPALALLLLTALIGLMVSVESSVSLYRAMILLLGWVLYESTIVTVAKRGINKQFLIIAAFAALLITALCLTITNLAIGILVPIPDLYDNLTILKTQPLTHVGKSLNPRMIAAVAVLLWPINAALAVSQVGLSRWQRFLHILAALLLIGVILFTQSPQGVLAVAAALLLFFVWWNGGQIRAPSRRKVTGTLLILFMPLLAALLLVAYMPNTLLATFLSGRAGFGFVARFELWVRAWRMIQSAPLTGIGLNNYSYVMDRLYPGYLLAPEEHAHQLYLQTLTDQGILGLFGLLLLFGITLWVAIRLIRVENDKLRQDANMTKLLLVTVIATIASWLAFGLLEVQEEAGVLLWLFLALPMGLAEQQQMAGKRKFLLKSWLLSATVALLTLILLWQNGYLLYNYATVTAQQALSHAATLQQDSTIALQRLEQAEERWAPAHLYRLRALLQVQRGENKAAAESFKKLAALEFKLPLWLWAPTPVLIGEWGKDERAKALESIYRHWYNRYPDRVEPAALLAYTFADEIDDKRRAVNFLKAALSDREIINKSVLELILADITNEE